MSSPRAEFDLLPVPEILRSALFLLNRRARGSARLARVDCWNARNDVGRSAYELPADSEVPDPSAANHSPSSR